MGDPLQDALMYWGMGGQESSVTQPVQTIQPVDPTGYSGYIPQEPSVVVTYTDLTNVNGNWTLTGKDSNGNSVNYTPGSPAQSAINVSNGITTSDPTSNAMKSALNSFADKLKALFGNFSSSGALSPLLLFMLLGNKGSSKNNQLMMYLLLTGALSGTALSLTGTNNGTQSNGAPSTLYTPLQTLLNPVGGMLSGIKTGIDQLKGVFS